MRDGPEDVLRTRDSEGTPCFGYIPVSRAGSHVRLRYEHPGTGEVRNVDVPQHDEVRIGTLRSIGDQCGADDFEAWCEWIDAHA